MVLMVFCSYFHKENVMLPNEKQYPGWGHVFLYFVVGAICVLASLHLFPLVVSDSSIERASRDCAGHHSGVKELRIYRTTLYNNDYIAVCKDGAHITYPIVK